MQLDQIVERIRSEHNVSPPKGAVDGELQRFFQRTGFKIPGELENFYRLASEATIFDIYRILPMSEVQWASTAILGQDDWCPRSWHTLVDMGNGDYVGIELDTSSNFFGVMIDCNHEQLTPGRIISSSLTEFLEQFLSSEDPYWLEPDFEPAGEIIYEYPPELYRRLDAKFWDRLGPEIGPEQCSTKGCEKLHISSSLKCRRHHYEMIQKRACPFDD